jgi:hypothetical protein
VLHEVSFFTLNKQAAMKDITRHDDGSNAFLEKASLLQSLNEALEEITQGSHVDLSDSVAPLPRLDATARFEQHMTRNIGGISHALDALELSEKAVIEIGVGGGAITKLLLERGAAVIGCEIDPTLVPPPIRSRITLLEGDYKDIDFSLVCSKTERPILIANPPYRELPEIAAGVIRKYNLKEYILFIPAVQRMLFPDASVVARMTGDDFVPAAIGQHLIIHGRAADRSSDDPPESRLPPSWKEVVTRKFAPLSLCEAETIDELVKTVALEIQKTYQRPITLLLTEDPDKLASIQRQTQDRVSLLKAPLYSHPEYIRKLLELPEVFAVIRPESAGNDYVYTTFQISGGLLSCTVSRLSGDSPLPLHS